MTRQLAAILKATSRSFWLTIRLLPKPMREGVAAGYLIARLSDTIADEAGWTPARRLALLSALERFLEGVDPLLPRLRGELLDFSAVEHPGERLLIERADEILALLAIQPDPVRVQLQWVLRHIVTGQSWDLVRFGSGVVHSSATAVACLDTDEELLGYCWRVAGSVGEFWGRLGVATMGRAFAGDPGDELLLAPLGARYGEALQLVNILRDLPEDWARGRCYLPGLWTSPGEAWACAAPRWIARAREGLVDAGYYAERLRSRRLRLATALPAAIGWETLGLLEAANYDRLEAGLKIRRSAVRRLLRQGLWASRNDQATRAWLEKLAQERA